MDDLIKEKYISLILSSFGLPTKEIEFCSDDIAAISILAKRQSILPIIIVGIKNLGLSNLLTDELIKAEAKSIFDFTQRKVSLNEISEAFDKASIAYIPLKGSVLRDLYPEPWMRTSSDIDVLIRKEDLEEAIKVLESRTSFKFLKRDVHDVHFVNQYVHLELHYSFDYSVNKNNSELPDPWANALPSNDSNRYSFTPEYDYFYNVFHSALNFIQNGGIGIRPLLDIYVLKTRSIFDEDKVKKLCSDVGILGFYIQCSKLIDVWFNGDAHDEMSRSLEEIVINGGVFGTQHLRLVKNKRNDSSKNYIGSRIFKTSDEIKYFFPKSRKYPILIPYYQVVRWIRLLKSKRVNAYVSEFKQADSIDQAEVDKYDKLLKAMGL